MNTLQLHHGDCLEVMRAMPSNSVDSIVTDPPYGLSFMGKRWDYDVPSVEVWAECLRVLKPGGHLLAFAGTRTQHRMAVRIEDAGFEIRDMIAWVYGSGFPKSLDVSKAIDKAAGAEREVVGFDPTCRLALNKNMNDDGWQKIGQQGAPITAPATEAARQWQGWGTALKPSLEPITVARKPLVGTVAANVLAHGTGGLNIDGCRVEALGEDCARNPSLVADTAAGFGKGLAMGGRGCDAGRWPANLIHDGSDEVVAAFPESASGSGGRRETSTTKGFSTVANGPSNIGAFTPYADAGKGSAARFFYCAKTSKADRGAENTHPTVKPTDLMAYLCRLVTPPGGVVLDPFMGSGSTGKAALREGFHFVGIEREAEYLRIAQARISAQVAATSTQQIPPLQSDLFSEILRA